MARARYTNPTLSFKDFGDSSQRLGVSFSSAESRKTLRKKDPRALVTVALPKNLFTTKFFSTSATPSSLQGFHGYFLIIALFIFIWVPEEDIHDRSTTCGTRKKK